MFDIKTNILYIIISLDILFFLTLNSDKRKELSLKEMNVADFFSEYSNYYLNNSWNNYEIDRFSDYILVF